MTTVALVLASVALAVAVTTAVGLVVLMRQSGETTTDLRRHRRAHAEAFGHADPKLDRRQVNLGAPRATGERRGARRYEPPAERLMPRPVDDTPTGELEAPETGPLEQQDQPTRLAPAVRPDPRPRPREDTPR